MHQQKIQVWLDCDPGLDDTFAIILAAKSPQIELLGVSTSAGNTNLDNTTKNALDVLYNIQRQDVLVVRGSEKLIHGQMHLAQHMHAPNGLGGVEIPPSPKKAIVQNNFQTIRDCIMNCKQNVIWGNVGALTNLCILLRDFPEIKKKISKIVMMGGAMGRGNITPAAQFNVYFDPVAFKQVLSIKQAIPLIMIPLQLTHQVKARQRIFNFLQRRNKIPFADALLRMLKSFKQMYFKAYQFDYPPIHDPCVINYVLHPDHFQLKKAKIHVDIQECSYGRTNVYFKDFHHPQKQLQSIDWVGLRMKNRKKFWEKFQKIFQKLFKENKSQ